MKALSIRQPWAYAILYLGKDIENRTWNTKYRGRIWIHAGQKFDYEGWKRLQKRFPNISGVLTANPDFFPLGGIVGSVEITDSSNQGINSDWWGGPPLYGFKLENPRPCKFFPYRGKLSFFNVPELEVK